MDGWISTVWIYISNVSSHALLPFEEPKLRSRSCWNRILFVDRVMMMMMMMRRMFQLGHMLTSLVELVKDKELEEALSALSQFGLGDSH